MARRVLVFTAVLVWLPVMSPVGAVQLERRPGSPPEQMSNPEVREREGGRPATAPQIQPEAREGTEEGLPDANLEPSERRKRFIVEPQWRLGVFAYNTETGVVITRVIPGSAAARAGFESGDRIITVGGFQVGVVGDRIFYLGEELQYRVDPRGRVRLLAQNVRNGRLMNIDVRLDSRSHRGPQPLRPRERLEGERPAS